MIIQHIIFVEKIPHFSFITHTCTTHTYPDIYIHVYKYIDTRAHTCTHTHTRTHTHTHAYVYTAEWDVSGLGMHWDVFFISVVFYKIKKRNAHLVSK